MAQDTEVSPLSHNFVYKRMVCGTPARLIEGWARVRLTELAS